MNLMKFLGCSILLGCLLAIGCSQEDECGVQSTNGEAKKAEVMKLAEKYGLTYQLDENLSDKEMADLNLNEMEAFFKSVKELTSKPIPLRLTKEGEAKTPEIITAPLLKTRAEEGSWSGSDSYLFWTIGVTVSWSKLTDGQLWHTEVSSRFNSGPVEGYSYEQTSAASRVPLNDEVVDFVFTGELRYVGSVTLHGAGRVEMQSGFGDVVIN